MAHSVILPLLPGTWRRILRYLSGEPPVWLGRAPDVAWQKSAVLDAVVAVPSPVIRAGYLVMSSCLSG